MITISPQGPIFSGPSPVVYRLALTILSGCLWWTTSEPCSVRAAEDWAFQVQFTPEVRKEPFSGQLTLFLSESASEPRLGPNWLRPEPLISVTTEKWGPGQPLLIQPNTGALQRFPRDWRPTARKYRVQAVARFQPLERQVGTGAGNGFSTVVEWSPGDNSAASANSVVELTIDRTVPVRRFQNSTWSELCEVPSTQLTKFHGRPMSVKAGVILPASYHADAARLYPVMFTIPGFGGTHFQAEVSQPIPETNPEGVEFLRVILDPSSAWGHHVFADSANNGPWGTALVAEWLPEFERRYRVAPRARFLTGHSSGGWSSLWLQVTHPTTFDGVWSTAPDSVDFRDFQQANLYRTGENAWVDPHGQRRPIAHNGSQVLVWWDDFDRMEQVLGPGGQFQSFEAVFSSRENNGRPRLLWNRQTGVIDPVTVETWKAFDIRRVLEQRWPEIGPQLQGKIHVFMGEQDTFFLAGATALLKTSLSELQADAVVEIHPEKDHRTLLDAELRDRIRREMAEKFLKTR